MKRKAIWASAHEIQPEMLDDLQKDYDVVFLKKENPSLWEELTNLQIDSNRSQLAGRLMNLSKQSVLVQPAGDPAFQAELGMQLQRRPDLGVKLIYAFSKRVSVDIPQEDGSVKKISTFKFEGWV